MPSMPWFGFEPTIPLFERAKNVHVLECAATVISRKGCIAPTILNLVTRWRWVGSFTLLQALSWIRSRHFLLDKRLGRSQSQKKKSFCQKSKPDSSVTQSIRKFLYRLSYLGSKYVYLWTGKRKAIERIDKRTPRKKNMVYLRMLFQLHTCCNL
jgi:hypothetical protein